MERGKDGLWRKDGKIYIPKREGLREEILEEYHALPVAGHPGIQSTRDLIERSYWWPGIAKDIEEYVKGCAQCQRTKIDRQKRAAPLNPNRIPTRPWQIISWDLIGPLPESKGFNAILVIVDRFSKQMHLVPTTVEVTAEGAAKAMRDHVFCLHGLPEVVISDRGPQFVSKFMKELYRLLGIRGNPSTAYHPQTDGQTERLNQEIEQYLQLFVNFKQDNWAEWLAIAEFAYNNRPSTATRQSPFFINAGQHPWTGKEPTEHSRVERAEDFARKMRQIRESAEKALGKAAERMKRAYDKKKKPSRQYEPGDKVWLDGQNLTTHRPSKKLGDLRHGPFMIERKVRDNAYQLKLPDTWRVHDVFNESLLTPYRPPTFPSQKEPLPPPPDLVDGEPEYEVESILDSRVSRRKLQYLVKWKGYPNEDNTWEPATALANASDAVTLFHRQYPSAPRPAPPQLNFVCLENFTEPSTGPSPWWNGKLSGNESHMESDH